MRFRDKNGMTKGKNAITRKKCKDRKETKDEIPRQERNEKESIYWCLAPIDTKNDHKVPGTK